MTRPSDEWPVGGSYTFGGRQGRMSPTRQRALDNLVPLYLVETPPPAAVHLVVEIGCGKGEATVAMALGEPGSSVIACEPNEATMAHLATLLDAADVRNVRLWIGDAFDLLALVGNESVDEVRVWFPDPWPKPRHAHKRLVTPLRLARIVDALKVGGVIRMATDDPQYAQQTLEAIGNEHRLVGALVPRPQERPLTTFEARALRAGREPIDITSTRLL